MSWRSLLVSLPVVFAASQALAASIDARDRAARTACLSGDHARGIALLTELFVDTKDPTYLYNQGRCYEQNRRYDDAIARFQEYLRAARRLSRAEKSEVEKHIADCEVLLLKQAVQKPPPVPVPMPVSSSPASQVVHSSAVTVVTPRTELQGGTSVSAAGASLRVAGVVLAAVGGGALVAGVALNLKANGMAEDMDGVDGYTPSKESERQTYETLGWVSYSVGAVCVVTGGVLYLLGARAGSGASSSSVAVVPALAPGWAGAVVKGAF